MLNAGKTKATRSFCFAVQRERFQSVDSEAPEVEDRITNNHRRSFVLTMKLSIITD